MGWRNSLPIPKGTAANPVVGDRRRGGEINFRSEFVLFKYAACLDCHITRWVRIKADRPGTRRCHTCNSRYVATLAERRMNLSASKTIHGHAPQGDPSALYLSWSAMMQRCFYKAGSKFPRYGGRGISVL